MKSEEKQFSYGAAVIIFFGSFFLFFGGIVLAIQFDDHVLPSANNFSLGNTSRRWTSINEKIYFAPYDKVGINDMPPPEAQQAMLTVSGTLRLNPSVGQAVCDDGAGALRGTLWMVQSGTTTKDKMQLCASDGSSPAWRNLLP